MHEQKTVLILGGILALAFLSCQKVEKADIAIQNVTVIDATGSPAKPGRTVLIKGNRIVKIEERREIELADNAKVVDGSGKYLIPGLWEEWAHSDGGNSNGNPKCG